MKIFIYYTSLTTVIDNKNCFVNITIQVPYIPGYIYTRDMVFFQTEFMIKSIVCFKKITI